MTIHLVEGALTLKKKRFVTAVIAVVLSIIMLAACSTANNTDASNDSENDSENVSAASQSSVTAVSAVEAVTVSYDSNDYYFNWQDDSYSTLDMSGGSQTVTSSGVYEITGTLSDGTLVVDVDKDVDSGTVYLVLNNTSISCLASAPIFIKDAEKVVLILETGSTNSIYQGSDVALDADDEPSAAIFSKADLTITGSGKLTVTSEYNDGITSKDTLKITDGTLVIDAVDDGIVGKDLLAIENGNIAIVAEKDGLRATNDSNVGKGNVQITGGTFKIGAGNDAIQAYGTLQIDGGTFELISGGGYSGVTDTNQNVGFGGKGNQQMQTVASNDTESQKCLKATGGIVINGGTFTNSSYEDSINSSGDIIINGGDFTIQAGDDAIHSDTSVTINGGTITIRNAYEGIEGANITINNGEISITTSDDSINVNDNAGLLTISGGNIYMNAGGDGTDSNGDIVITGGTVFIDGPTDNGNGALDYNGTFTISGGILVAAGSSGMAESPGASSAQPSIMMYYSNVQSAGTTITLKDESGTVVVTFTPSKQYSTAAISAPGFEIGQTYTLYSGDAAVTSIALSDAVTYLNESGVTTNQGTTFGGQQFGGDMPNGGGKPNGGQRVIPG